MIQTARGTTGGATLRGNSFWLVLVTVLAVGAYTGCAGCDPTGGGGNDGGTNGGDGGGGGGGGGDGGNSACTPV
ncbi:MAG TPA: hypothetical protein VE782_17315, partial [Myxococcaceae bacterium]|nr:hypothetical protein [Myxococcaceae bacterium]